MSYRRFANPVPLTPSEKVQLLAEYFSHYRELAEGDLAALNANLPREAYAVVLEQIGGLLLEASEAAATRRGPLRDFLDSNPLPAMLSDRLPDDFRAFCLALNALKQWLSAEQAYTDRYLLGGRARDFCRQAATHCIVTGNDFNGQASELHHPARDGRPPLLLSKEGHSRVHGQVNGGGPPVGQDAEIYRILVELKRRGNRAWIMLRVGCESHLGLPLSKPKAPNVLANCRVFAKKAAEATRMSYRQLLSWLDERGLA